MKISNFGAGLNRPGAAIFATALLALNTLDGGAQSYDTALIPAALKKDAKTVKREERVDIEIRENDRSTYRFFSAVTIMDPSVKRENYVYVYTDKLTELESLDVKIYDAQGKVQGRHSKKDMISQAAGEGLVEDGKAYYLKLTPLSYPVTIEKEMVIRKKGFLQIPPYRICQPDESVQHSSFTVKHPASMKVNAKSYQIQLDPKTVSGEQSKSITWETSMVPARRYEEGSGPWTSSFPHVLFNTSHFNYDGYAGNLSTWKDFGLWYNDLVQGINRLHENEVAEIRQLVAGVTDDKEKIRILYRYLQQHFRYVSIQLGIGGFRPFSASFVHQKKYGDCKALSNYMEACLHAVGIKAYSAWINAGDDQPPVDPSFTYDNFNHQILCVPLANKDTVWLECTSNYNDFGHLGSFTENRLALLLKEDGGVLVRTPESRATENRSLSRTRIILDENGAGQMQTRIESTGSYKYEHVHLSMEKEDDLKMYLVNRLGYANPDDWKIRFGQKSETPFPTDLSLTLEKVPDFMAGSKMFLRPRMYSLWDIQLPASEKRTADFLLESPVERVDTTSYQLPPGYGPETLPQPVTVQSPFGVFTTQYWFDAEARVLHSAARLRLDKARIPAAQFDQVRTFIQTVKDDSKKRLIIKPM